MASIMDEFVATLEAENEAYGRLVQVSREKTRTIVEQKVDELMEITAREQAIVEEIMVLEKKRTEVRSEMAKILKVPAENLTLLSMSKMFEKRPEDKKRILDLREKIRLTLVDVARINKENETLLNQSMEMLEYDINLIRSTRVAPTTANYDRYAYNTDTILPSGGFNVTQ